MLSSILLIPILFSNPVHPATLPQYDVTCSPPTAIMNVDGVVYFGSPAEGDSTILYHTEVNGRSRIAVIAVTLEGYNLVMSKGKRMVTYKYYCDTNGRYVPAPSAEGEDQYAPKVRFK